MSTPTPPPFPEYPVQSAAAGAVGEHGSYSFLDAIKQGFRKYVTFSGRARRSEFWYWVLFSTLVSWVVGGWSVIPSFVDAASGNSNTNAALGTGLSSLVSLALFLPSLAVGVRRLHDTGRSGWWYIVPNALGLVAAILFIVAFGVGLVSAASDTSGSPDFSGSAGIAVAGGVLGLGAFVTGILMLIWLCADGGPNTPNKYGVRE